MGPPDTVWGWLIKALFQGLPVRGRILLPQQGRRRPAPVKGRCGKLQSEWKRGAWIGGRWEGGVKGVGVGEEIEEKEWERGPPTDNGCYLESLQCV